METGAMTTTQLEVNQAVNMITNCDELDFEAIHHLMICVFAKNKLLAFGALEEVVTRDLQYQRPSKIGLQMILNNLDHMREEVIKLM